ncbi:hypothetical protein [Nitrosomonas sp.]|uniref:hypothetical protein n=1 Tax=Nitrosomonas sp. TaxID=42353 RepID=UPI0025D573D0|nr:hypothetical protein [Nitrosomonas sp.]MBY0485047.1 hypothetical protein [Nitrosomonas sp.]
MIPSAFTAEDPENLNKAPRRKQQGIKIALQTAGFQPALAPRGEELNPEEIKKTCFQKAHS